jgi:hypothetical protein
MTPKETLQAAFEAGISPHLQERGFGFVRSQFGYQRKVGVFTQHISVTLSHYNTQQSITFWSAFNVASAEYNKWRKQHGLEKFNGYLGGSMDWNIPGWREPSDFRTSFDFSEPEQREYVLSDWLHRCLSSGIPYLDALSTWEGLANDLLRWNWHWGRPADFFMIAGETEKAVAALQAGIEFLLKQDYSFSPNAHPTLVMKKKRQEKERDTEVGSFRRRISLLRNSEQNGCTEPGDGACVSGRTTVAPGR